MKFPSKIAVKSLVFSLGFFLLSQTEVKASMFDSFVSKVKIALFITPRESEVETQNVYKANVLAPALSEISQKDEEAPLDESGLLEVKNGSMRLSTEDIDYPLEDTITTYEVKDGDTIASVAKLFGVTKNTILWANDLTSESLKKGDVIVILPITGLKYAAKKGDTIASIAKKYKGDGSEIAKYNGLAEDSKLALGQEIIIPDGEIVADAPPKQIAKVETKQKPSLKKLATTPIGFFVKPLLSFIKTQDIHGKNAVDLAAKLGSPVVATASGKVIVAKSSGYNGGYGEMIVIAHQGNIQTLYAHLSAVSVKQGDTVEQGQVIGALGSTGRSTGPHLHIEVRGATNPF